MKLIFILCVCLVFQNWGALPITLTLKPDWKNLDANPKHDEQFGGQWILVGTLDLKKRCHQSITLNKLIFKWKGKPLDHLSGSLYKKELDQKFLPIQKNLICDSLWDKKNQHMIFIFEENIILNAHTIFNLVLTIPEDIRKQVGEGIFELEESSLPTLIKQSVPQIPTLAWAQFLTKKQVEPLKSYAL